MKQSALFSLRLVSLHQGPEQTALGLHVGGGDVGRDAMRQAGILGGHGEGDVESQLGGEDVVVEVDLVEGGGSLEVIGDTHGRISLLALGGELRAVCHFWSRSRSLSQPKSTLAERRSESSQISQVTYLSRSDWWRGCENSSPCINSVEQRTPKIRDGPEYF